MNNKNINIIDSVVNPDLCTGCGACVYYNNSSDWKMDWNNEGFLIPTRRTGDRELNEKTINVCPFNPNPADEVRTEDELSDLFLKEAPNFHPKVGRYFNTYVGYSEQFRLTSSSGGIATYILNELFERELIDAAITVGEGENNYYKYKLVTSKEDLLSTSKTKYYPVTMADALNELRCLNGKVAVVGVGCFIKAVRLLQHYNPEIHDKIVFTVGIICGGLKSKFFSEYLASKSGVIDNVFTKPQFRIKDLKSSAGDYAFGCLDIDGVEKQIKMKEVGDMWGTGMFKCNACDFCDDVTTELADISLGDAWLKPYIEDSKGTNIIIIRSLLASKIIIDASDTTKLHIEKLDLNTLINTQSGSYNHRQTGLQYRIKEFCKNGQLVPPKRNKKNVSLLLDFKIVQYYRMKIRKKSLENWINYENANLFDIKMKKILSKLKKITKLYHYRRVIFTRKILQKIIKRIFK